MTRYRRFETQGDRDRVNHLPDAGSFNSARQQAVFPDAVVYGRSRDQSVPAIVTTEPRLALLIGNSRYKWQEPIENPVRDVRLIAWTLEGLGFAVSRIENAGLTQMQDAVLAFGEALEAAGSDAVALVYFAGHGVQQDGANFLIPTDAQLPSPRYLTTRAMALDAVVTELGRTKRKATLVILDACRTALPGLDLETGSPTEGLARGRLPAPAQLVYSTAAEATSSDGERENSPFATALADELPSLLTPGRRIQDVIDDVAAKVSLATSGEQTVAVYREGVLMPLALTVEDEERLRDWSKRRPYRLSLRQVIVRSIAAAVALAMLTAATLWFGAYPETRTTWLLRAGLLDRIDYDFACEPPWDERPDKYGLTRRDWCLSVDDSNLTAKVETGARWEAVKAGLAQGDPKALYLTTLRNAIEARSLSGSARSAAVANAMPLADRVARTDLPRGGIAPYLVSGHPLLAERGMTSVRRDVEAASARGILIATLLLAVIDNSKREAGLPLTAAATGEAIETALRRLDENDPTGRAADLAAWIFSGRIAMWIDLVSPERERYWLERAAFAGHAPAAADFLDKSRRLPAYALSADRRDRLYAIVSTSNDPRGKYWRAQSRRTAGVPFDDEETIKLLTQAAEGGYAPAVEQLADFYLSEGAGREPDIDRAVHWLQLGVSQGDAEAIVRLAAIWARGIDAHEGKTGLAARPEDARNLLERAEVADDPRAMMALATLLRYGPEKQRDPARAERLLKQIEARMPYPDIALAARGEANRITTESALALGTEPAVAIAIGDPGAPVTLSIAVSDACETCTYAIGPGPLRDLVARRQLRLSILPIWQADGELEKDAALLTVCAARETRFDIFMRLLERRNAWASAPDRAQRRQAMSAAIADLNGRPPEIDACLADHSASAALERQRDFLVRSMGVTGDTIFVGGRRIDYPFPEDVPLAVKAQLPPDTGPTAAQHP